MTSSFAHLCYNNHVSWGRKGSTGKAEPGLQAEDASSLANHLANKVTGNSNQYALAA